MTTKTIKYKDDENLEWVIGDDGLPKQIIRDHATMRVSLMDAMAARGQLTDAEKHLMLDQEWRRHSYYNRPGFRTSEQILGDSAEGKVARQRVADANAAYERRVTQAYRQDSIFEENTDRLSKSPTGASERQFIGQREGDLCTINGYPGRLRSDENGQLQCVADHDPQNDHRSLSDKMQDHEVRMREEYNSYCKRQAEAYKTLR